MGILAGRSLSGMAFNPRDNEFLLGGGQDSGGIPLADMWILKQVSGSWQWERVPDVPSVAMVGPLGAQGLYSRLSYDTGSNAFLINGVGSGNYANGSYTPAASQFFALCRSGCSNAGRVTNTYATPQNSVNKVTPTATSQSFAVDTGIAVSGTTLYTGWVETGAPFDSSNCGYSHPYVNSFSGSWSGLFSPCTLIDPEPANGPAFSNSSAVQLAIMGGNLWATHGTENNAGLFPRVLAKQWNGSTWVGGELGTRNGQQIMTITGVTQGSTTTFNTSTGPLGVGNYVFISGASGGGWNAVNGVWPVTAYTGSSVTIAVNSSAFTGSFNGTVKEDIGNEFQGSTAMADVGGVPTFAFIESDNDLYRPFATTIFVDQLPSGPATIPTSLGGALNRNALGSSYANDIAMASTGTFPVVAWTEEHMTSSLLFAESSKIYVSQWNGSSWTALGGALNQSSTAWAMNAAITYMGGSPYAAWAERTVTGVPLLYVSKWNGSAWSLVGSGALNKDTNLGWAARPRLTNDGTNVYVSWVEQNQNGAPRVYASSWNGSVWTSLGGALNNDPAYGRALGNSITMFNGKPTVLFTEATPGNLGQATVKQWNGADWAVITAATTAIGGTLQKFMAISGVLLH